MSLSTTDLQAIRSIVREEVDTRIDVRVMPEFSSIHSRLRGVEDRLTAVETHMIAMDEDATVVYEMLGKQHMHLKLHDKQVKNAGKNFEVLAEYAGLKLKKPLVKL